MFTSRLKMAPYSLVIKKWDFIDARFLRICSFERLSWTLPLVYLLFTVQELLPISLANTSVNTQMVIFQEVKLFHDLKFFGCVTKISSHNLHLVFLSFSLLVKLINLALFAGPTDDAL